MTVKSKIRSKAKVLILLFVVLTLSMISVTGYLRLHASGGSTSATSEKYNPCSTLYKPDGTYSTLSLGDFTNNNGTTNYKKIDPSTTLIGKCKYSGGTCYQLPGNTTTTGRMVYKVPYSSFPTKGGGQVYTFQVCVFTNKGASQATQNFPAVFIGNSQVKSSTGNTYAKGAIQRQKEMAWLAQNGTWTLYRSIFYVPPTAKQGDVYITLATAGNKFSDYSLFINPGLFAGDLPTIESDVVPQNDDLLGGIGWFDQLSPTQDNPFGYKWSGSPSPVASAKAITWPTLVDVSSEPPPGAEVIPSKAPKLANLSATPTDLRARAIQFNAPADKVITVGNYRNLFHPISEYGSKSAGTYTLTYWIRLAPTTTANGKPQYHDAPTSLCDNTLPYVEIDDHNGTALQQSKNVSPAANPPASKYGWQQCQGTFWFKGGLPDFPEVSALWYQHAPNTGKYQITGIEIPQLGKPITPAGIKPSQVPLIADFTKFFKGAKNGTLLDTMTIDGPDGTQPMWLIPKRTIGSSDQVGVQPKNVEIINDPVSSSAYAGKPVLRLRYFGGDDSTNAEIKAGIDTTDPYSSERQGAAVVSSTYYASGIYVHCVRLPYNPYAKPTMKPVFKSRHYTGAVSAFWPYLYQALPAGAPGYNNEGGYDRNSEVDWEIPGAYETAVSGKTGVPDLSQPGTAGYGLVGYGQARLNSWGGQWGGVGNNVSARPPLADSSSGPKSLTQLNDGNALDNGKFVQISYIIDGGTRTLSNPGAQHTPGQIAWYFAPSCKLLSVLHSKYPGGLKSTAASLNDMSQLILGTNYQDMPAPGELIPAIEKLRKDSVLGTRVALAQVNNPTETQYANDPDSGIYSGANYGQDNIPYKPMRDWVGVWSPGGLDYTFPTYDSTGAMYQYYWGWGGTPDFMVEGGTPDFYCESKLAQKGDPKLTAWLQTQPHDCTDIISGGIDSRRKTYLTALLAVGGVRTADGAWPAYYQYGSVSKKFSACKPSVDDPSCVTNERDEDLASIIIMPLYGRPAPTDEVNYQEATNNYLCYPSASNPQFPFGCSVYNSDPHPAYNTAAIPTSLSLKKST
ncbi:MAG: hypothetical protein P1U34_04975 [Coxiellaceae bacterium]|nr:hypothetical protein [Coxiellaceae bacterium]